MSSNVSSLSSNIDHLIIKSIIKEKVDGQKKT